MAVGRPPKPVEQKRRIGNPGGRKLPTLTVVPMPTVDDVRIPDPHRPLMKKPDGSPGAGGQLWLLVWE